MWLHAVHGYDAVHVRRWTADVDTDIAGVRPPSLPPCFLCKHAMAAMCSHRLWHKDICSCCELYDR
jgi:hypothetical protein